MKTLKLLKKPAPLVKHFIHRELGGWEKPRDHSIIHASDLFKPLEFCPRERALLDMGLGKGKDDFIGTALRMTFDHGRSMEWNMRNVWIRRLVVGQWSCPSCGAITEGYTHSPASCPDCGFLPLEYVEPRATSPYSGVSGSLDFLLDVGKSKLRPVELKSIDKDNFKKVVAPLAEHKARTSLYLRLIDEWLVPGHPLHNRVELSMASVLYVSKAFGIKDTSLKEAGIRDSPFSPIKEYFIKRDDSLTVTAVAKARVLHEWRKTLHGFPAGVCLTSLEKRSQQCSCVKSCWSGSNPPTLTWLENGVPRHPGKKVVL